MGRKSRASPTFVEAEGPVCYRFYTARVARGMPPPRPCHPLDRLTVAEAASWRTPRQKDQFRDFAIFRVGPWQHVNWAETWQRVIGKLGPSEHNGGTSVCILVRTKEANTPLAPFFMLSTPISRCRDPRKGAKKRGERGAR